MERYLEGQSSDTKVVAGLMVDQNCKDSMREKIHKDQCALLLVLRLSLSPFTAIMHIHKAAILVLSCTWNAISCTQNLGALIGGFELPGPCGTQQLINFWCYIINHPRSMFGQCSSYSPAYSVKRASLHEQQ